MTDAQLLSRFREDRSPEAYAQIVRRHIDLVYSVARRRVGDPHLADDVTQAVFVVLARKAPRLADDTNLPAWLHKVARCAAVDALKLKERRSRHEQAAAMMRPTTAASALDDSQWEQVALLLDDAIASLGARDRELVIARYLQGRSTAELAAEGTMSVTVKDEPDAPTDVGTLVLQRRGAR